MNKELTEYILTSMGKPDYIERWSGIVQTLNVQGKNLPAGYILAGTECGLSKQPQAIIPDSKYKGILFCEDKGLSSTRNLSSSLGFRSEFRIICWLNNDKIGADISTHALSTYAEADITQRLSRYKPGNGIFMLVRPAVTSIAIQDASIFSKYDFDDKTSGYLQGNFSFFALDVIVNFFIPKKCVLTMNIDLNNCN